MFSSRYRQIIKDRNHCNVYRVNEPTTPIITVPGVTIVNPEASFKCVAIGDTTKDAIPGKKQTKVARLVDLVRHTRGGKIMNGYDPQMDPYSTPPPPIIDGLRHGIVPVGMRKNKF
jgi:hypothetical protein